MRCEKCGKEINMFMVNMFDRDGSDYWLKHAVEEYEQDAVVIDTYPFWTGYELSEEEMLETITCPHCNEFPFEDKEIQVYDIVRIICFKKGNTINERFN